MNNKTNIALVGFMGSGKTSVSKLLAQKLGKKRVSTDDLIEEREERSISDIFRDSGEPYFRDVERQIISEVSAGKDLVIDCGGGVVLDKRNMDALRSSGTIVYIKSSPEFIYECIKEQTHRPLLQVEDPLAKIRELLNKREEFYLQADLVIDGDRKSISDICGALTVLLSKKV
jgi:shikimate kinase